MVPMPAWHQFPPIVSMVPHGLQLCPRGWRQARLTEYAFHACLDEPPGIRETKKNEGRGGFRSPRGGVEEEGEDRVDEGRGVREEEWINEGGRGKHPEVTHPWRV